MRVNVGINPKYLTNEHLLAEYHEIQMLASTLKNLYIKNKCANKNLIPSKFCLGKGHFYFFYNKIDYLYNRCFILREECLKRDFNINVNFEKKFSFFFELNTKSINIEYIPDYEDICLITNRIKEKINSSPKKVFHYYTHSINKEYANNLLTENMKEYISKNLININKNTYERKIVKIFSMSDKCEQCDLYRDYECVLPYTKRMEFCQVKTIFKNLNIREIKLQKFLKNI